MSARRLTATSVAAALLLTLTATGSAQAAKPQTEAKRALAQLVAQTRTLPKRAVKKRPKAKLVKVAKRVRKLHRKKTCRALKTLRAYNRGLRRVRVKRYRDPSPAGGSPRGRLRAQSISVQAALLRLPRARRCGGAKANRADEAKATVLSSNERQLRLRVQLPPAQFVARQVRGRDFLEMTMDGMGGTGDDGSPGLPHVTRFFAIPQGATVSIDPGKTESYTLSGVNLYPEQPDPVDQAAPPGGPKDQTLFEEPPLELDRSDYRSNKRFPASPVDGGAMGAMRDLLIGGVSTAGGQYRPKSKTLKVFTSIDVTVNFRGDNSGVFGPSTLLNQWNQAFADDYNSLLNLDAVRGRLANPIRFPFCGEELLIITSPALRPAADTLADQRRAQGYVTSVREVGSGPGQIGTTNTQIQSFIRDRLLTKDCLMHPSYVILFGDAGNVPTFVVPCGPTIGFNYDPADPSKYCDIASDLPYSLNGVGSDLFADVQLGRLPAPDLATANGLVTKLQTYSTTNPAPPGDDFLDHAAVTSYFEQANHCVLNPGESGTPNCDSNSPGFNAHWEPDYANTTDTRGFTITAERIRNAIAADGYTVDRLYHAAEESDPTTYWNGTPVPAHLRKPGFAWDAGTPEFLNAYNEGRFVILHRDHGSHSVWYDPTLHSGHVPGFTNGTQQPVVFGINCSSAMFDLPGNPSFVERQITRLDGGAIAGFGDTRVSPSFPNNHMALGFFDAMFPSTVADYGGPETRRLGDILIRGKQYMATQEGFEWHGSNETYQEHYLYHLLGDPTMQMWSDPPVRFDPNRFKGLIREIREFKIPEPGDPPFFVQVTLESEIARGTMVTLFRGPEAIGRGFVGADGVANVIPDVAFDDSDDLSFSLQQDGAFPAQEDVEKTATTLSATCASSPHDDVQPMTTNGTLSPGFAGASVVVTYTKPDGASFERTVTTDASGAWSSTITPASDSGQSNPDGTWTVQARYAGDASRRSSTSSPCTVEVQNF
jgi:hypothetical protein